MNNSICSYLAYQLHTTRVQTETSVTLTRINGRGRSDGHTDQFRLSLSFVTVMIKFFKLVAERLVTEFKLTLMLETVIPKVQQSLRL